MHYKIKATNPNLDKKPVLIWDSVDDDMATLDADIESLLASIEKPTKYKIKEAIDLNSGELVRWHGKTRIVDYIQTIKDDKKFLWKKKPGKYMINITFTDNSELKLPIGSTVMVMI